MRKTGVVVIVLLIAQSAVAQGIRSNEIANCSTMTDPTRQRLCIESAQQARPASTFDPTADSSKQPEKVDRRPPRRDVAGALDAKARPPEKRAEPTTEAELKRKDWRLQIP